MVPWGTPAVSIPGQPLHCCGQAEPCGEWRSSLRADVKNRRGQGAARGRKITGLQFLPGDPSQLLITSNDSRIRLYDGPRPPFSRNAPTFAPCERG